MNAGRGGVGGSLLSKQPSRCLREYGRSIRQEQAQEHPTSCSERLKSASDRLWSLYHHSRSATARNLLRHFLAHTRLAI